MIPFVLKRPSAWVPLVMSLLALVTLAIGVATVGVAPQPDEGAFAHLWQSLVFGQLPVIAFFVVKWVRPRARLAFAVLGIQLLLLLLAALPVHLLNL